MALLQQAAAETSTTEGSGDQGCSSVSPQATAGAPSTDVGTPATSVKPEVRIPSPLAGTGASASSEHVGAAPEQRGAKRTHGASVGHGVSGACLGEAHPVVFDKGGSSTGTDPSCMRPLAKETPGSKRPSSPLTVMASSVSRSALTQAVSIAHASVVSRAATVGLTVPLPWMSA